MKKLLILFVLCFAGCGYNTMQVNEEGVNAAWGDVEAAYQRRMDLIPNLIKVVKGYATHEKETLTLVTEARAKATSVQLTPAMLKDKDAMAKFQSSQDTLGGTLSRLMMITEKYPELKANQNFTELQKQLEETENRINVSRTRYNEAVRMFNISIRTFPNSVTNSFMLHLESKQSFKASEGADKAPEVNI